MPLAEQLNLYQPDTVLNADIGMADGSIRIDVRAKQDEPNRVRNESNHQLAEAIVDQRRRIGRLERCAATSRMEDEVTMLASAERRVKASKWRTPELQERLAKLPKLRECLGAVATLAQRACHLETEVLGLLYQRDAFDRAPFSAELNALEIERLQWMREVFRQQQDQPDEVVLAFYSEHRETLLEFAMAYHGLGAELGEVMALDYFLPPPGARSTVTKLVRESAKKMDAFRKQPDNPVASPA